MVALALPAVANLVSGAVENAMGNLGNLLLGQSIPAWQFHAQLMEPSWQDIAKKYKGFPLIRIQVYQRMRWIHTLSVSWKRQEEMNGIRFGKNMFRQKN